MDRGETSEANVSLVRRLIDAHNSRDVRGVQGMCHDDVDLQPFQEILHARVEYHGHEGVEQFFRDMAESWTAFEIVAHRVEEMSDDRVLVSGEQRGRGRTSGATVSGMPFTMVVELRGGQVSRCLGFRDVNEALDSIDAA